METNGKIQTVKLPKSTRNQRHVVKYAARQKANIKKNEEILTRISKIRHYNDHQHKCGCGVGFLRGKLVEYQYNDGGFTCKEITLSRSAEWIHKMLFSEIHLGLDCADREDEAELRWFNMVQCATA